MGDNVKRTRVAKGLALVRHRGSTISTEDPRHSVARRGLGIVLLNGRSCDLIEHAHPRSLKLHRYV